MALRLRIIEPDFRFNADNIIPQMSDLFCVQGFLGHWRNPSHIIVAIEADLWIIPIEDVEEKLVSCDESNIHQTVAYPEAFDLGDRVYGVWFEYVGNDPILVSVLKAWAEKHIPKRKEVEAKSTDTVTKPLVKSNPALSLKLEPYQEE